MKDVKRFSRSKKSNNNNNNDHIVSFILSASHVVEAILQLLLDCAGSLRGVNYQTI